MPAYSYKAVTRGGDPITGQVVANDRDHAFALVLEKGELPTAVKEERVRSSSGRKPLRLAVGGPSLGEDRAQFTGQLAALIAAGVPLAKALTLSRQIVGHPKLSEALSESEAGLEAGQPLSAALSLYPDLFPPLYVGLVRSGEEAGQLADVLDALARYLEGMNRLGRQAVTALIYPMILVVVTVLAVLGLLLFVLPEFEPLLSDVPELAWHTELLFGLSAALRENGLLVALGAGALVVAMVFVWQTQAAMRLRASLLFQLPVAGSLAHKLALSRFAFTIALCSRGGLPLLHAVDLSQDVTGGPYSSALGRVAADLKAGRSLSAAMADETIFEDRLTRTVEVGEASGQLADIFSYLSKRYELEFDEALKRVLALLEPCLILILGIVVGGVVGSVLVAVFAAQSGVL